MFGYLRALKPMRTTLAGDVQPRRAAFFFGAGLGLGFEDPPWPVLQGHGRLSQ
jgi:hypothetical protein